MRAKPSCSKVLGKETASLWAWQLYGVLVEQGETSYPNRAESLARMAKAGFRMMAPWDPAMAVAASALSRLHSQIAALLANGDTVPTHRNQTIAVQRFGKLRIPKARLAWFCRKQCLELYCSDSVSIPRNHSEPSATQSC
jgi:hypothetical protein